jgi:hypothetical protein
MNSWKSFDYYEKINQGLEVNKKDLEIELEKMRMRSEAYLKQISIIAEESDTWRRKYQTLAARDIEEGSSASPINSSSHLPSPHDTSIENRSISLEKDAVILSLKEVYIYMPVSDNHVVSFFTSLDTSYLYI